QRQLAAPGISGAVDRADDRHGATDKGAHRPLEQEMLRLPCLIGHAEALFQITAGAKRLVACTRHDDAAIGERVAVDLVEEAEEVSPDLRVHRVGDLRPVQGQQHEPVALVLDTQSLVAAVHRRAPARRKPSPYTGTGIGARAPRRAFPEPIGANQRSAFSKREAPAAISADTTSLCDCRAFRARDTPRCCVSCSFPKIADNAAIPGDRPCRLSRWSSSMTAPPN